MEPKGTGDDSEQSPWCGDGSEGRVGCDDGGLVGVGTAAREEKRTLPRAVMWSPLLILL
jgi:hypothetical protein